MSRNFVPALFAIGVGVFTGYYTFNPTFAQLQYEKEQSRKPTSPSGPSIPKQGNEQGTEPSSQSTFEQDPKPSAQ